MKSKLDTLATKLTHAEQAIAVAAESKNVVFLVSAVNTHKAIAAEIAALSLVLAA